MSQIINTNIMSLNAQRNLSTNSSSLATTIQRLSSGLRINSAKDDAAGLAISERFTTQIRGMNQAARNANDGISLAQTAEGALGEIGNNLQRIRELSVQARNATNSASDRAALNAEVQLLKAEVQRVAEQTNFNGTALLDGSFTNQAFQVGADQGQIINIAQIANANISSLGNWNQAASPATATGASIDGGFVAGTPDTTTAIASATQFAAPNGTAAPYSYDSFAISVNGTSITIPAVTDGTTETDARDKLLANVANAINNNPTVGGANGLQIDGTTGDVINNGFAASISGPAPFGATISVPGAAGRIAASYPEGSFTITGKNSEAFTISYGAAGSSAQRATDLVTAINNQNYNTGVSASLDASGKLVLNSSSGNFSIASSSTAAVFADQTGLTAGATNATTPVAGMTQFTEGAAVTGFAMLDISLPDGADNAILAMDAALEQINSARADLGAIQNRFQSTIANLNTSSENLSAARSRIRDTDFAKETAELTRTQILQQAGTAMLAQANQVPQNVLSLLK